MANFCIAGDTTAAGNDQNWQYRAQSRQARRAWRVLRRVGSVHRVIVPESTEEDHLLPPIELAACGSCGLLRSLESFAQPPGILGSLLSVHATFDRSMILFENVV